MAYDSQKVQSGMGCPDWHTAMQSSATKTHSCGSTALRMPESVGMNKQIDWQAQQIPHLVCSLAGQRCSEAWGNFWTWTDQSITALIAWRKEEWRKESADIPPSEVGNDLCLARQTSSLFQGQPWGDSWETGRVCMGLSEHYSAFFSWNWNWTYDLLHLTGGIAPTSQLGENPPSPPIFPNILPTFWPLHFLLIRCSKHIAWITPLIKSSTP